MDWHLVCGDGGGHLADPGFNVLQFTVGAAGLMAGFARPGHSVLRRIRLLDSLVGILVCGSAAAFVSLCCANRSVSTVVPLAFILVEFLAARRFGILAGLFGSLVAALTFSYFLYEPFGSIYVASESARSNLSLMLVTGIAVTSWFRPKVRMHVDFPEIPKLNPDQRKH